MTDDVTSWVEQTQREIGGRRRLADGEGRSVVLRRSFDATIEDVWEACTDPERLGRWFLPVTGDLRPGGTYQLQGNAGGEILRCEEPRLLTVSWVYGDAPAGEVELRLSPSGEGKTTLELEHAGVIEGMTVVNHAMAVGTGWDPALISLGMFLRGEEIADPAAWMYSPEVREFNGRSVHAWGEAVEAAGASTGGEVATAVEASLAQLAHYYSEGDADQSEHKTH